VHINCFQGSTRGRRNLTLAPSPRPRRRGKSILATRRPIPGGDTRGGRGEL
jgi:hypothetical protein